MNISDIMISMKDYIQKTNPNIPRNQLDQVWDGVEEKVKQEPPPVIAIIGESGVGKSSTLNALFGAGQSISHTEACTQEESKILLKGDNGTIVIYDMPGLSESLNSQEKHLDTYKRVLSKCDIALWIFDAQNRALANIQRLLTNDISNISPDIANRMVFAVNKIDLVHPGSSAWISSANLPSEEQDLNIKARLYDIHQKMKEAMPLWTGAIVGYSAEKRYNLPQLFGSMLDGVSKKRQWVLSSRKSLADYFELVDPELLPENKKRQYTEKTRSKQKDRLKDALAKLTDEEYEALVKDRGAFSKLLGK